MAEVREAADEREPPDAAAISAVLATVFDHGSNGGGNRILIQFVSWRSDSEGSDSVRRPVALLRSQETAPRSAPSSSGSSTSGATREQDPQNANGLSQLLLDGVAGSHRD